MDTSLKPISSRIDENFLVYSHNEYQCKKVDSLKLHIVTKINFSNIILSEPKTHKKNTYYIIPFIET